MNRIIAVILLLLNLNAKGCDNECINSLKKIAGIKKSTFQILFLNGSDCINCNREGKIALEKKLIDPDVILVRDVPKRTMREYVTDEIGIDLTGKILLKNDSLYDCLNSDKLSSVGFIENDMVVKVVNSKKLSRENLKPNSKHSSHIPFIDSIDITSYYGGRKSTVVPFGSDYLILNDTKNRITHLSGVNNKKIKEFDPKTAEVCKMDSIKSLFVDFAPESMAPTIRRISESNKYLNGKFQLSAPYVYKDKIYVPMQVILLDSTFKEGKPQERSLPHTVVGVFDKNWNKTDIFGFPYILDSKSKISSSPAMEYSCDFQNDCNFWISLSTYPDRIDSLAASFDFCNKPYPLLKKYINVKYPSYFPTKDKKYGYPITYIPKFVSLNNHKYYYFTQDNQIFDVETGKGLPLDQIPQSNINSDTFTIFMINIKEEDGKIYVITKSYPKDLRLNIYNAKDFSFISSTWITSTKLSRVFFQNDMICAVYSDDERVTIYRYKYK